MVVEWQCLCLLLEEDICRYPEQASLPQTNVPCKNPKSLPIAFSRRTGLPTSGHSNTVIHEVSVVWVSKAYLLGNRVYVRHFASPWKVASSKLPLFIKIRLPPTRLHPPYSLSVCNQTTILLFVSFHCRTAIPPEVPYLAWLIRGSKKSCGSRSLHRYR